LKSMFELVFSPSSFIKTMTTICSSTVLPTVHHLQKDFLKVDLRNFLAVPTIDNMKSYL
jgi:hypothetical protein